MAARLLSVNVGLPRDIAWQGKTVRTAVWKAAVQGPRVVRRLNVDGDRQGDLAGHGGEHRAVFVYQMDSYRYWQSELGRDDFTYGQFGENFTVEGLPDQEVCIGDRYRIGSALFEVTQPRVTCYRVGIRMNEPRMAALLVAHGRPGFYLRVLEEGQVEAGDEIVQVAVGPERMTVSEIDALLYLPGRSRIQLERALRIPALSAGWRGSFQALLAQERRASRQPKYRTSLRCPRPPPAWAGFRSVRVSRKSRESVSVTSLTLEPMDGLPLTAASPASLSCCAWARRPDAPAQMRSYSLSGEPSARRYRISVKREPHGVASAYIDETVQIGDVLELSAPRGNFTLRTGRGPRSLGERREWGRPLSLRCSTPWRPKRRGEKSGGYMAPGAAANILSPRKSEPSSKPWPAATVTYATVRPSPRIGQAWISTLRDVWTWGCCRNWSCRATPISSSAGHRPS